MLSLFFPLNNWYKEKCKKKKKKCFQTVKDQMGDYISQEAIFHGGEKLIIGSFKCFKNKLAALN